jgi:SAM-dependent methyltransferase
MEQLRKEHNLAKRSLIRMDVKKGSKVLDCGCGMGGDWSKWKEVAAQVYAIDPDSTSLEEAMIRSKQMKLNVKFLGVGDICNVNDTFDVICYNFSLQYIVPKWDESINAIARNMKKGGILIGIVPEFNLINKILVDGKFTDRLGNHIEISPDCKNLNVKFGGGPFYASGSKTEPILDFQNLINSLSKFNIKLINAEPMLKNPNGLISDIYMKFIFKLY